MSLRVISYDDARSLTRVWDDLQISNMPIFKEASENGSCKIISNNNTSPVSIEILIMDDTIDKNVVGFLVCFNKSYVIKNVEFKLSLFVVIKPAFALLSSFKFVVFSTIWKMY